MHPISVPQTDRCLVLWAGNIFLNLGWRHPEVPRFHQRDEGSRGCRNTSFKSSFRDSSCRETAPRLTDNWNQQLLSGGHDFQSCR
jgi:hypothetical protein